jgi:hypothetical protein
MTRVIDAAIVIKVLNVTMVDFEFYYVKRKRNTKK